jgi:hypothetical protein
MANISDKIAGMHDSTNVDGTGLVDFVLTRAELIQLMKYWVRKAIDDDDFIFWAQCFGSSDLRRIDFDWKRVNEIAQKLGKTETDRAVTQAYEDTAQDYERSNWVVFRYGTEEEQTAYQHNGGECLSEFEPGVAEQIARSVVQRVLREGTPEQQHALIKDELGPYATKMRSYQRASRHIVEIFGICFPAELRRLIPNIAVDGKNERPNDNPGAASIEQGKAFLAKLDETARKGESALKALVAQPDFVLNENTFEPPEIAI